MIMAISFGSLATIIRRLNAGNLKSVAWLIGLPDPALKSWCLSVSYLRNLCAHHSRIWNRTYTLKPFITRQQERDLTPNDRTYAQAVTLRTLLKLCSGPSEWAERLKCLLAEHPNVPASAMGFPMGWMDRPFWN
jgi:abortive infection bacteriophage resistance protein